MNTNEKAYPSIGQGFLLILIMIGYASIAYTLSWTLFKFTPLDNSGGWGMSLDEMIIYVIGMVLAVVTAISLRKKSGLIFKPLFRLPSFSVIIVSVVAILSIGYMLEWFTYIFPLPDFMEELLAGAINNDPISFITTVIAAPVLEEILLRGVILDGFLKKYSPGKSIFWSAIIFGVMHLNPWQAVIGIGSGLLLGWLYWKTKSLGLCILLHATNNALAYLIFLSVGNEMDTVIDYMGLMNYFIVFIVVLIVLIGCMRFLNNHFKKHEPIEGELPI